MPQYIISPLKEHECKFNVRIKEFPTVIKTSCFSSAIFNPYGVEKHKTLKEETREFEDIKEFGKDKRKYTTDGIPRNDNVKRAKDKAFEIAYANEFKYFITFTLDESKINRYETSEIIKKLKVWLSNKVERNDFTYIIFPEYHKQKENEEKSAIHFHGLCSGNLDLIDSGKNTANGQKIYNCENWLFGFSTVIELSNDHDRIVNYVMKYITKDSKKIFGRFYFSGGKSLNCLVPTFYDNVEFRSFQGIEYNVPNAPLSVKYKTELRGYGHDD